MTTWELLIANSSLVDGSALDHLEAQEGGGTQTYVVLAKGLDVDVVTPSIEITVDQQPFEVEF